MGLAACLRHMCRDPRFYQVQDRLCELIQSVLVETGSLMMSKTASANEITQACFNYIIPGVSLCTATFVLIASISTLVPRQSGICYPHYDLLPGLYTIWTLRRHYILSISAMPTVCRSTKPNLSWLRCSLSLREGDAEIAIVRCGQYLDEQWHSTDNPGRRQEIRELLSQVPPGAVERPLQRAVNRFMTGMHVADRSIHVYDGRIRKLTPALRARVATNSRAEAVNHLRGPSTCICNANMEA